MSDAMQDTNTGSIRGKPRKRSSLVRFNEQPRDENEQPRYENDSPEKPSRRRSTGSSRRSVKKAQSADNMVRANTLSPSLRDEVAIKSQTNTPWAETSELMARFTGSSHEEDDAPNNSGLQIMMQIRTDHEDLTIDQQRFYHRAFLVHPGEPWLRHWMGERTRRSSAAT